MPRSSAPAHAACSRRRTGSTLAARPAILLPLIIGLLALPLIVSCATAGPAGERTSPNMIVADQIEPRHTTAYDVVQDIRPRWMRTRGTDSMRNPSAVRVYLNSTPLGGVDALRGISAGEVTSIRYFGGAEATQRFGPDHGSGAIVVATR